MEKRSFWSKILIGMLALAMLLPMACASKGSSVDQAEEQARRRQAEEEARKEQYRANIEVWSGVEGTVLLNGEEQEAIDANGTVTVTLDNADGSHTVAVQDDSGIIIPARATVLINKTGIDSKTSTYITYYAFVLDPDAQANAPADFDVIHNMDGVTITNYKGTRRQVVIAETINGQKVTAIGQRSFSEKEIVDVVIPNTVKTIGPSAFSTNNDLTELAIPDSVTEIGGNAFSDCGLISVTLGRGIQTASAKLASGIFTTRSLSRVVLPGNIHDDNMKAFPRSLTNSYKDQGKKAGRYVKKGSQYGRD